VAAKKEVTNKDFAKEMFGLKKKQTIDKDGDVPTINYLNNRKYSEKFYGLLETRKILPAWAAKKQIIDLVTEH
jgi:hypothetical protein